MSWSRHDLGRVLYISSLATGVDSGWLLTTRHLRPRARALWLQNPLLVVTIIMRVLVDEASVCVRLPGRVLAAIEHAESVCLI